MKITKFTKILPVALALALSVGCVNAAIDGTDEETEAVLNYQLTLNDYIKITPKTTTTLETSGAFDEDYKNLQLTGTMESGFKIISNAESRVLTLKASNSTTAAGMYGFDKGNFYLVFTNSTATTEQPTAADVQNITTGGNTLAIDKNKNAIAFKVTATATHTGGPTTTPFTPSWDTDHIKYTMKNGTVDITYVVNSKAEDKTFSTHDTQGTYIARLTLTDETHP